jgi:hypothetical protein
MRGTRRRSLVTTYRDGPGRPREVVMKAPLLTVIMVIALIVVAGQTVKKACKTGHHAWCVPTSTWHHTKARAPV